MTLFQVLVNLRECLTLRQHFRGETAHNLNTLCQNNKTFSAPHGTWFSSASRFDEVKETACEQRDRTGQELIKCRPVWLIVLWCIGTISMCHNRRFTLGCVIGNGQ